MGKRVGHKKRKGPRMIIKRPKITAGERKPAAGPDPDIHYPTKVAPAKAGPEIYVKILCGEYHKAHLRIRERKLAIQYGQDKISRYLYLAWRQAGTVKEYYLGKIAECL